MANGHNIITGTRRAPSLTRLIQNFWRDVNGRLVKVHRITPSQAKRAVLIYRRRVGKAALNRGELETARDIAAAIRRGGFGRLPRKEEVVTSLVGK